MLHVDAGLSATVAAVLAILIGAVCGAFNGFLITGLKLPSIVVTIGTMSLFRGIAFIVLGDQSFKGYPASFSWFGQGYVFWVISFELVLFLVAAVLFYILLHRTNFGRRVYAIGNGMRAAELSGVPVGSTTVKVYMLSGLCAALVGCLLAGFSGQGSLGMGDEYLLPSIAVVVVGGALITGGRGSYIGMLGGVLLLTALQTLLSGTTLPYASRAILYGAVVLCAVVALREKNS